jgi:DNA-binding response OmpR family regulator
MKNILIVDDDFTTQTLLSILLEKEGYTCKCCSCCNSALNTIPQKPFTLVISDVKMPGNDGMHLLKRIKQDYRDVKVMMMSAERLRPEDFYFLGALDFFHKLDGKDQLLEKIRRIEQDKRCSRRFDTTFAFLAEDRPAKSINVSSDGILFESREQFTECSLIEVLLKSKADDLKIKGKVIRSVPAGSSCRTALYFNDNVGPFLQKNYKGLLSSI